LTLASLLERLRGLEVVHAACAFCDWRATGTVEETRQAFEQHACDHPKPEKSVRRRSGYVALVAASASVD
jgi:hypothetical protein